MAATERTAPGPVPIFLSKSAQAHKAAVQYYNDQIRQKVKARQFTSDNAPYAAANTAPDDLMTLANRHGVDLSDNMPAEQGLHSGSGAVNPFNRPAPAPTRAPAPSVDASGLSALTAGTLASMNPAGGAAATALASSAARTAPNGRPLSPVMTQLIGTPLPSDVAQTVQAQNRSAVDPVPLTGYTPVPTYGNGSATAAADAASRALPGGRPGMVPVDPSQQGNTYVGDGQTSFNGQVLPAGQTVTLLPGGRKIFGPLADAAQVPGGPPSTPGASPAPSAPAAPSNYIAQTQAAAKAYPALAVAGSPENQRFTQAFNTGGADRGHVLDLANSMFGQGAPAPAPAPSAPAASSTVAGFTNPALRDYVTNPATPYTPLPAVPGSTPAAAPAISPGTAAGLAVRSGIGSAGSTIRTGVGSAVDSTLGAVGSGLSNAADFGRAVVGLPQTDPAAQQTAARDAVKNYPANNPGAASQVKAPCTTSSGNIVGGYDLSAYNLKPAGTPVGPTGAPLAPHLASYVQAPLAAAGNAFATGATNANTQPVTSPLPALPAQSPQEDATQQAAIDRNARLGQATPTAPDGSPLAPHVASILPPPPPPSAPVNLSAPASLTLNGTATAAPGFLSSGLRPLPTGSHDDDDADFLARSQQIDQEVTAENQRRQAARNQSNPSPSATPTPGVNAGTGAAGTLQGQGYRNIDLGNNGVPVAGTNAARQRVDLTNGPSTAAGQALKTATDPSQGLNAAPTASQALSQAADPPKALNAAPAADQALANASTTSQVLARPGQQTDTGGPVSDAFSTLNRRTDADQVLNPAAPSASATPYKSNALLNSYVNSAPGAPASGQSLNGATSFNLQSTATNNGATNFNGAMASLVPAPPATDFGQAPPFPGIGGTGGSNPSFNLQSTAPSADSDPFGTPSPRTTAANPNAGAGTPDDGTPLGDDEEMVNGIRKKKLQPSTSPAAPGPTSASSNNSAPAAPGGSDS